jgi:hypothetical protein
LDYQDARKAQLDKDEAMIAHRRNEDAYPLPTREVTETQMTPPKNTDLDVTLIGEGDSN